MRIRRVVLRSIAVLAVLVAGDMLLSRWALADGMFFGRAIAPFDPPLFSVPQRRSLESVEERLAAGPDKLGKFDSELGWSNKPSSGFGEFRYDWSGARIGTHELQRVKQEGVRRVVAVGCSMTHGEEVKAVESWCARADDLLPDVEVANLGVAAYGTDQALLRLRRDGWPLQPDEVWLGVMPQAALRVTTFFRPLLDHWSLDVAFKPRFSLGADGQLELLPSPAGSMEEVLRLLHDQESLLRAFGHRDPWIERSPVAYAPRGTSWMHRSFAARLVLTIAEKGGRRVESCFSEEEEFGLLYDAIVRAMAHQCAQRGMVFSIFSCPGRMTFSWSLTRGARLLGRLGRRFARGRDTRVRCFRAPRTERGRGQPLRAARALHPRGQRARRSRLDRRSLALGVGLAPSPASPRRTIQHAPMEAHSQHGLLWRFWTCTPIDQGFMEERRFHAVKAYERAFPGQPVGPVSSDPLGVHRAGGSFRGAPDSGHGCGLWIVPDPLARKRDLKKRLSLEAEASGRRGREGRGHSYRAVPLLRGHA